MTLGWGQVANPEPAPHARSGARRTGDTWIQTALLLRLLDFDFCRLLGGPTRASHQKRTEDLSHPPTHFLPLSCAGAIILPVTQLRTSSCAGFFP